MHSHCPDHMGRKTIEARRSHKISWITCHGSLHAQPCSAGNYILLVSCQLSVICTKWIKLMPNGIVCPLVSSLYLFQQILIKFGIKPVYQMLDKFSSWCVIFSLPFCSFYLFIISVLSTFSLTVLFYTGPAAILVLLFPLYSPLSFLLSYFRIIL